MVYTSNVLSVIESVTYRTWFDGLKDRIAKARIDARIRRMSLGNLGDFKAVGDGVNELRIDCGPGYRVYFARRGSVVIILLCGGSKHSQKADIRRAARMVRALEYDQEG